MNQFFRRVLSGLALLVAVVGTTGCQHESQAEQETVRTVSYRAVMESDKPVSERWTLGLRPCLKRIRWGS